MSCATQSRKLSSSLRASRRSQKDSLEEVVGQNILPGHRERTRLVTGKWRSVECTLTRPQRTTIFPSLLAG